MVEVKPIRILNLGLVPPWQTQAVYHMLAERMTVDAQDAIVLCQPDQPYLCLGYHQTLDAVFDADECARRRLPIFRRRLGGGATYLDRDQIFYQCIFHHSRLPVMLKDIYALALSAPVNTLQRLGINAELRDTNEIEVDSKRIAGTGGGRLNEACVVVGNLLFKFDFASMIAVWKTPSSSFRSLAEQALRQQLITLDQLAATVSMEQVTEIMIDEFSKAFRRPLQFDTLTTEEIERAEEIANELVSDDFLALHRERGQHAPMRSLKVSARAFIHADETRMNDYNVRGSFWVSYNMIQSAKLESEPMREWQSVEERLTGAPFGQWREHVHV